MKNNIKVFIAIFAVLTVLVSCKKSKDYSLGDLTTPTNLVITADIVGQNGANPDGDGSGDVNFTLTADNALSYKIDYNLDNAVDLVFLPTGTVTKKYTTSIPGTYTYTVTAVAYGKGGTSTSITKDITVYSSYTPDATIVTNLTNDASKTWVVEKDVAGHFGVGPYDVGSIRPEWYAAAPNEKAACCPCFYSATFTFTKGPNNTFSLAVATPQGAFTKTGTLAGGLPGIPASGDEGCYSYSGGTSAFVFQAASSGAPVVVTNPANSTTTETSILLSGVNTYIGYGAVLKEYEILTIDATHMYLRVQGTETGNAWYIRMLSQ